MKGEVIIVGAGPAGAHLAGLLADAGISTLVIEGQQMPRSKPCGGAISAKAFEILSRSVDLSSLPVERTINKFTFRCSDGDKPVTYRADDDGVMLVSRRALDAHLVNNAARKGARVQCGTPVQDVVIGTDGVSVQTSGETVHGQYVVGADGATGRTARSLGLADANLAPALRCRVSLSQYAGATDTCRLDYGDIPGGYSWVFPKSDHLNVGAGIFEPGSVSLRRHFNDYLRRLGLDPAHARDLRGHPIPTGPREVLSGHRFLLIGDAAHLCDPLTGEGIHAALASAETAAEILVSVRKGREPDLKPYEARIREMLGSELQIASGLSRIFMRFPQLIHRIIAADRSLLSEFFQIVAGRRSYTHIHRRILRHMSIPRPERIRGETDDV